MEDYNNFEICDQCISFRELTDHNFHREAEEFSECGCCLDLDTLNMFKESVIKIENWWIKHFKMLLPIKNNQSGEYQKRGLSMN